jgi:hypothetical protein
MRHGRTVVPVLLVVGLGLLGFARVARCGEPFDDRLGNRTPRLFLLMRSDVQADLGLSPAKVVEINRAAPVLYRRALRLKGKTGTGVVAARRELDEVEARWLIAHLTPDQLLRLDQIDLQWEGAGALLDRTLINEDLGLTRDQQETVVRYIKEADAQRPPGGRSLDEHINLTRRAISALSDKQKTVWIHLLGPPCRFSIDAKA